MHRTRSIDYAIVLSGEIWAVMDVGETKLVAGDVLVQRGTNHAWANRSNAPCVVAFVLIDAIPLALRIRTITEEIEPTENAYEDPIPKTVGDHLYVAALLPFDQQMKIDEAAYRQFPAVFLEERKIRAHGRRPVHQSGGR